MEFKDLWSRIVAMTNSVMNVLTGMYQRHVEQLALHISSQVEVDKTLIAQAILSFSWEVESGDPLSGAVPPSPRGAPLSGAVPKVKERVKERVKEKEKEKAKDHPKEKEKEKEKEHGPEYRIISFYTDTCHAIFGLKEPLQSVIDKLGRREFKFNGMLSRGKGWIFPLHKLTSLESELQKEGLAYDIERGTFWQPEFSSTVPDEDDDGPSLPPRQRVIKLNKFGRHEDPETGLLFRSIDGTIAAYGVEDGDGSVLAISEKLLKICKEKGYIVAPAELNVSSSDDEDSASDRADDENPIEADESSENTDGDENEE